MRRALFRAAKQLKYSNVLHIRNMQLRNETDLLYQRTFMVQGEKPEPNRYAVQLKTPGLTVLFAWPGAFIPVQPEKIYGTVAVTSAELALSTLFESTEVTT
jgi:hypothetical protein